MAASPITAVLVHSPFLGPASLRPLADALAAHGHPAEDLLAGSSTNVVLLDLRPSVVSAPVHQVLVGAFADAMSEEDLAGPVVLIGHSGAGPLLPAFADALEDTVTGLVFVDAGLPTPGRSWRDTVPAELYTRLKSAAREGRLPRWQRWFAPDPLVELVADEELRAEIADEAPEVPVAFLKETRPEVEWSGPAGYVALSDAYTDDVSAAEADGWPVRRLDSHHLAPATDPDPVAVAVLEVLAELLREG
jgi:pimeloyl-ACP methyl ester carboxylesterase